MSFKITREHDGNQYQIKLADRTDWTQHEVSKHTFDEMVTRLQELAKNEFHNIILHKTQYRLKLEDITQDSGAPAAGTGVVAGVAGAEALVGTEVAKIVRKFTLIEKGVLVAAGVTVAAIAFNYFQPELAQESLVFAARIIDSSWDCVRAPIVCSTDLVDGVRTFFKV